MSCKKYELERKIRMENFLKDIPESVINEFKVYGFRIVMKGSNKGAVNMLLVMNL